jgi:ribosome-binding protein aMBF1 (putative translation factor)
MEPLELKSDKVKMELDRLGWSERDLAKEIGTSQALVNYWIKQKSVSGAHRIAEALGIDKKDLVR